MTEPQLFDNKVMQNHQRQISLDSRWYEIPNAINQRFCGVFEGGGAKGVAYCGALQAMKDKKCWFKATAGASAGAITAALIAAGLTPEEIRKKTPDALKQIQTRVWPGLNNLSKAKGYFPSDKLRDWLNKLFQKQIGLSTGRIPDWAITFKELYQATGIELNIVAADLSLKSQVVFSCHETPECAVADAVVASSAIPFAFASRLLEVVDRNNDNQVSHHTIVDGGVWSNFPMYVFEDKAFRMAYEREPSMIKPEQIIGFILKESEAKFPPIDRDSSFVQGVKIKDFNAKEWHQTKSTPENDQPTLVSKIGAGMLYPFSLLGRLLTFNSGIERGRWPQPKSKVVDNIVHGISGLLVGIHPLLFGLVACAIVAIGAEQVTSYAIMNYLRQIAATDWTHPISYLSVLFGATITMLCTAIAVLIIFVTLVGVTANRILLRSSRRILYGLLTTYVEGAGAPAWVIRKANIVALTIPKTIDTLSFEIEDCELASLLESAYQETTAKLNEILPQEKSMVD